MKKSAIVTGGSKNQYPAMAVLAINIKKICPNIADELIIFHDGIPESEQKKINNIFPTRFIEYKNPFVEENGFVDNVSKYFTTMIFCKYECFRLLNSYHTVIWTDYDVIIKKDISNLLNINNDACFVKTSSAIKVNFLSSVNNTKLTNDLLEKPGIATPIFVLHDSLKNYNVMYNECINLTNEYANHLYLPEQAIVSLVVYKYSIQYYEIPVTEYAPHPIKDRITEDTKILHAYGQPKFWNGLHNEDWEKYYKEWRKVYKGEKIEDRDLFKILLKYCKKIIQFINP